MAFLPLLQAVLPLLGGDLNAPGQMDPHTPPYVEFTCQGREAGGAGAATGRPVAFTVHVFELDGDLVISASGDVATKWYHGDKIVPRGTESLNSSNPAKWSLLNTIAGAEADLYQEIAIDRASGQTKISALTIKKPTGVMTRTDTTATCTKR